MEKLKYYFDESKKELSKVIFPTKEQVRNAFLTVLGVVFVIALFLAIIDALMAPLVSWIVGGK